MSTEATSAWTRLAHLLRPQGRKGELLAEPHADPSQFSESLPVFLAPPAFAGPPALARPAELDAFWLPSGKNQGRIVLHFAGVDTISEAELLAGLHVYIPTTQRVPLEDGAQYVEDLIGCLVFNGETQIGTLDSIEFSTAPDGRRIPDVAPLLTVVTIDDDEVLIPYVHQFLISVDTQSRRIHMQLPPGLVELNLATRKP